MFYFLYIFTCLVLSPVIDFAELEINYQTSILFVFVLYFHRQLIKNL